MAQNRSHAVMAQRVEVHDSLDYFPTPPWATRALCDWLRGFEPINSLTAWEPACGEGHMARPLGEYFKIVVASDIYDYGYGVQGDFLFPYPQDTNKPDWIITNPPFRLGYAFAVSALSKAERGVAMLVRTAFLESSERYTNLFRKTPPTNILQFVERVPMLKGRLDRRASTATAYCWIVWVKDVVPATYFQWIAPCRARLERDSDYPEGK